MNSAILTEVQEDAFAQLLNIGMGLASASLSEMVCEEVTLSVPSIEFLNRDELSRRLATGYNDSVTFVRQSFTGTFWGNAVLLFPEDNSMSLVRAVTGDAFPLQDLTDMEQDVLSEIGNIVLNSCLGSLANVLGNRIQSDIPECMCATGDEILLSINTETGSIESVMLLRLDFSVPNMDVGGYVVFLLEIESIQGLQQEVDNYLSPVYMENNA